MSIRKTIESLSCLLSCLFVPVPCEFPIGLLSTDTYIYIIVTNDIQNVCEEYCQAVCTCLRSSWDLPANGTLALTGEPELSPKISFAVFRISPQSFNISSLVVLKYWKYSLINPYRLIKDRRDSLLGRSDAESDDVFSVKWGRHAMHSTTGIHFL